MSLMVGTASVDITPAVGTPLACFPDRAKDRPRIAMGAHDPLEARALALSDGTHFLTLCSLDLTGIRRGDVTRIRDMMLLPGLAGSNLILAATHTHSAPDTLYLFGGSPDDPVVTAINQAVAEAVLRAQADSAPASLSVASEPLELSHNRRVVTEDGGVRLAREFEEGVTTGPTDPTLTVLRFDDERDEPLAVLFHWTAHPLTLGPGNNRFSADYPGLARAVVEDALPGATALFFNGAAGNVHPRQCTRDDREATELIGGKLGRAVARMATGEMERVDADLVRVASRTLRFANRMAPSHQVQAEVSCARIGPVIIGAVPGEYFVQFQLQFRLQAPADHVLLLSCANGWAGYIPTREAYEHGGYGVEAYDGDPVELSRTCLPPGAGEQILETLLELAEEIE